MRIACKLIAVTASHGSLGEGAEVATGINPQDEQQKPLDVVANKIMLSTCEWGGQLAGMVSEELEEP